MSAERDTVEVDLHDADADPWQWGADRWIGLINAPLLGRCPLADHRNDDLSAEVETQPVSRGRVPLDVRLVDEDGDTVVSVNPKLDPEAAEELAESLLVTADGARQDRREREDLEGDA